MAAVACAATLRQPLPAPGQAVTLAVEHGGLLTVVERGQEIAVRGNDVVEIATPPRLGKFSVLAQAREKVQIARARPGTAQGYVSIRLDCNPDDQAASARAWEAQVQALEHEIAAPLAADAYEHLQPRLEAIGSAAAPGYAKALAAHLRAQALLMAGRSTDATTAFALARQQWLALGDRERALAALVAEAEDSQRSGAYRRVLSLARSLDGAPVRDQYFGVRLENARCLALQYLAELDASANCFEWTLRALGDLGETLERISTQQDYALVERDRGNLEHATTLAAEALAAISGRQWNAVPGPDIPIVRGRVERLLSALSVRRGDIAEGLRHSQRALAHFDQARHLRWQANTLLFIAVIYNEIGAQADAIDAVDAALQRLSPRDAPDRIAEAELRKAEIELAEGSTRLAIEQASKARSMFESLQTPAYAAAAALTLAEANLASGQAEDARAILQSMAVVPPALASRAELVRAELDVQKPDASDSRRGIEALGRSQARPLAEWLRVQAVLARQMLAAGHRDAALRLLEKAANHVSDLAWRARNPVLRVAIERQRRQLLSTALPIIAAAGTSSEKSESIWRWLLLTEFSTPRNGTGKRSTVTEEFDRALAESLLPSRNPGTKASAVDEQLQQHLLALVTAPSTSARDVAARPAPDLSLRRFQATLPEGTLLVALLSGGSTLAVLGVSADKAEVFLSPDDVPALRKRATGLTRSIVSYGDLTAINHDIAGVSQALLGAFEKTPAPRHLLVVAPEPFNELPWPALLWPESQVPLVETTSVSLVAPGGAASGDADRTVSFHVFAAAAESSGENELPALAAAGSESSVVAGSGQRLGWRLAAPAASTRSAVLAALDDPGSWVHIAAHGSASIEYLGRSGIWLSGTDASGGADLLSWMDVVEQGIQARTVILNACALASTPMTSLSASTGFAEATLRSGADEVVAALWPINDTAASLWASTFYAHLPAQPSSAEIAEALRTSMLRLRDSRAFRHPRYWASLVHLARIGLPAKPDQRGATAAE